MARIFALTFGLLVAGTALFFLGAGSPMPDVNPGVPHDAIDVGSREKLDGVLRAADH